MKYEILYSEHPSDLQTQVESFLGAAWKCQGGIFVAVIPAGALTGVRKEYYQAMVHEG